MTEQEVEEVLGEIKIDSQRTRFIRKLMKMFNPLENDYTGRMFTNCGDLQLPAQGFGRGFEEKQHSQ